MHTAQGNDPWSSFIMEVSDILQNDKIDSLYFIGDQLQSWINFSLMNGSSAPAVWRWLGSIIGWLKAGRLGQGRNS